MNTKLFAFQAIAGCINPAPGEYLGADIPHLDKVDKDVFNDFIRTLPDQRTMNEVYAEVAKHASTMITTHPQYGDLAARLLTMELYNKTPGRFHYGMKLLYDAGVLNKRTFGAACKHKVVLDDMVSTACSVDFKRFTYQGMKHMMRSYLLRGSGGELVERPHWMYMRIALGIHYDDVQSAVELFDLLLDGTVSMASPIMFNSGTTKENLASCFIQNVDGSTGTSSMKGILDATRISEGNGGVGINYEGDTCAEFCIVLDKALKWLAPQGGLSNMKRPGVGAVYRSVFEADFLRMLANKKTDGGPEDTRAKDLQLGMVLDDVFLDRVERCRNGEQGVVYSTFSGEHARHLRACHGKEFSDLYHKLEAAREYKQQIPVDTIARQICTTLLETGVPYTFYKDSVNHRSNHASNRGTVKGSNLCAEITQFSGPDESAVCVLGSIDVAKFYDPENHEYDLKGLARAARVAVKALDRVIDNSDFPTEAARKGARDMRSLGLGLRNLGGLFIKAGMPFDCIDAQRLNGVIAEVVYCAGLNASIDLAEHLGPYPMYEGSDYSKGILQMDYPDMESMEKPELWRNFYKCGVCETVNDDARCCPHRPKVNVKGYHEVVNWADTKKRLAEHGARNSQITAIMPTVGTSQMDGGLESIEPLTYLMYKATVFSGEFQVVNRAVVEMLEKRGCWTPDIKSDILSNNGMLPTNNPVLHKRLTPDDFAVFRTAWEIKKMTIVRMARVRGQFVDQSQSLNLHMTEPQLNKIVALQIFMRWCGLKTVYYTRTRPASVANKITTLKRKSGEEDKTLKNQSERMLIFCEKSTQECTTACST